MTYINDVHIERLCHSAQEKFEAIAAVVPRGNDNGENDKIAGLGYDLLINGNLAYYAFRGDLAETSSHSKGMIARLAYSIALHQKFDILLVDEIFSGEDEQFKKKISEKILKFNKHGKTIFFVSHDLEYIKKYCDKVLWIKNGKLKEVGNSDKIINKYIME